MDAAASTAILKLQPGHPAVEALLSNAQLGANCPVFFRDERHGRPGLPTADDLTLKMPWPETTGIAEVMSMVELGGGPRTMRGVPEVPTLVTHCMQTVVINNTWVTVGVALKGH